MKKPPAALMRMCSLSAFLLFAFIAVPCQVKAATSIENDRYSVNVEATDGTFTIATKPSGKIILPAGKLSGTGGTAKTIELADKALGKGQGIEVT